MVGLEGFLKVAGLQDGWMGGSWKVTELWDGWMGGSLKVAGL